MELTAALCAAALCAAAAAALVLVVTTTSRKEKKEGTAEPPTLGNFWETVQKASCAETPWFLLGLTQTLKEGERVFRMNLPPVVSPKTFVVAEPWIVRRVMSTPLVDKPKALYDGFTGLTKGVRTIFTKASNDPMHAKVRKGIAPAFSARRVQTSLASKAFNSVLDDLYEILDAGEPFDPAELMTMTAIDVLGRVSLGGFDFSTLRKMKKNAREEGENLGQIFLDELPIGLKEFAVKRLLDPTRKYYWLLTASGRRAAEARDKVLKVARKVLEYYDAKEEEEDGCALLDHVMRNKHYRNDEERVADVFTFLVAGHDTTGYSAAFALFEIAKRPEDQKAMREEIRAGTHLAPESLLDRTCKEALRLWPVAAMGSFREVNAQNGLDVGQFHFPKGSTLIVPMLPLFRTAQGVLAPDVFDPDRWLDPAQVEPLKGSFFPFSLGTRNCVGMALAQSELRHLVAAVVSRYDLSIVKDFVPGYFLTLKPTNGLLKATKVLV